jgi:RimJ/RimL family protein N-acetyltransferase
MRLRPAVAADARLLWRWANDPATRAWSYLSAKIPWEGHRRWLAGKLETPRRSRIYVAMAPGPAGQIRFEVVRAGVARVGVSVAPEQRGRGLGVRIIRQGCRRASRDLGLRRVLAYIKTENAASVRAFERAGFRFVRRAAPHGAPSLLLAWNAP